MASERPPIAGSAEPVTPVASARLDPSGLQYWLTCVVFCYPFFLASIFLVDALPALIRVTLFGYQLRHFELGAFGVFAFATPPDPSAGSMAAHFRPRLSSLPEVLLLVAAAAGLLARVRGKYRPLPGLFVAMLGQVALLNWLWRPLVRKQFTLEALLASTCFLAVLPLGLRWMLDSGIPGGYAGRMGSLLAGFLLPSTLILIFATWAWYSTISSDGLLLLMPTAAACLGVSSIRARDPSSGVWRAGGKTLGCGVASTLLVASGATWGGRVMDRAFERSKQAAEQAVLASLPAMSPDLPYPRLFFQRGVNLTAEFPEPYDSEGARRTLEALPAYGVNAIALVPYGWASPHSPRILINSGGGSWESDVGLEELSRLAHARGMRVLLKPGIWVRGGGYGGDLSFSSAEDRAQWFEQYGLYLEHYARLGKRIHADILCVGGELPRLSPYDAAWRKLIGRARELYPGPLVYAANFGPEFENLTFWDALDYIGLQEYYPLPADLSTEAVVREVEAVQRKYQRPVIFAEAGFPSREAPNQRPWDDSSPGKISLQAQARCYEALLRAFYHQPWFEGIYWWKVGTNGAGGVEDSSLTPWGKPAMQVVKQWYLQEGR